MVSIIIPVYNSEKTISLVCEKIIKTMVDNHIDYEIILVDDYSIDSSYEIMKDLNHRYNHISCIKLKGNFGQQNALLCGLRHGRGDYYVTIDDDLQNMPKDIITLLNKLEEGYDVVYGIQDSKVHKDYRGLGTMLKELMFTTILGKPGNIKLTSFRIMKEDVVKMIIREQISYVYLSASILKHTKNIANVYVPYYTRLHGKSNYNLKKLYKLFINILIYYGDIPLLNKKKKNTPQYIIEQVLESNDD
jgi:undecaprenyl-phosphate 4-deoxy-4-formamido-L-arabinose transferase